MRVPIPHELPREEARRRLRDNAHKMVEHIPGPMAEVLTDWPSEDRMGLTIKAMGQTLRGTVDIEDRQLVVEIALPPLVSFMEPVIAGAMKEQGQKLLAKD
ncbi:polyhydroxyalkanoic acid system family protein [Parerythrobacter aurantius]|uniref:polyhydroxyalkanoic acid system family protein n=1 Tax=Parerythrobacter aurantius TaxID=3127706 RepID=UPI0032487856